MVTRLTRVLGARHLELAEDAVQEALVKALHTWPVSGVPDRPAAWLFAVARNKALDHVRRSRWLDERAGQVAAALAALASDALDEGRLPFGDADLCVMFLTCHPALSRDARVALTLKTVCGFGVDEIARAYLQPAPTIAQRLVRARRTLREVDAVADMPQGDALETRRGAVLEALYLMFNEGYAAHDGDSLTRPDVCEEAVRLTRLLALWPRTASPDTWALLSLMLLHSARLRTRTSPAGDILLLHEQDRTHWDQARLAEGFSWLERSASGSEASAYHVQAAIAATHVMAGDVASTDWARIVMLYEQLQQIAPSPVARLNQAIAIGQWQGAAKGLEALEAVGSGAHLARYYLAHAVRGVLLERVGRRDEAHAAYARALECHC